MLFSLQLTVLELACGWMVTWIVLVIVFSWYRLPCTLNILIIISCFIIISQKLSRNVQVKYHPKIKLIDTKLYFLAVKQSIYLFPFIVFFFYFLRQFSPQILIIVLQKKITYQFLTSKQTNKQTKKKLSYSCLSTCNICYTEF